MVMVASAGPSDGESPISIEIRCGSGLGADGPVGRGVAGVFVASPWGVAGGAVEPLVGGAAGVSPAEGATAGGATAGPLAAALCARAAISRTSAMDRRSTDIL